MVAPPLIRLLALTLIACVAGGTARASSPARACEQAALTAAAETGVPADILGALTLTETGRRRDGVVEPWAWSVNAEGTGTWFDEPDRALAFAEDRVAQGRRNLDIGCFQLNYRWHGEHFGSVAEMFDPLQNARYAARFLGQLHAETGDWRRAAGAFHSRSPAEAEKYLARFDTLHATLQARGWTGMTGGDETYNSFASEAGPSGAAPGIARDNRSGRGRRDLRLAEAEGAAGPGAGDDGGYLGVGVEVPVPDMSGAGPIDVALAGDASGGFHDGSGDPGGGADGWQPPVLPGEAAPAVASVRHRRPRGEARSLLGAPLDGSARASGGSLALIGAARGPLLRGGHAIIGPPREATLALAGP